MSPRSLVRNAASASVLPSGDLVDRAATHDSGIGTRLETLGGTGLPSRSLVTQPFEQGLVGRLRLRHVDLLSRLPGRGRYAAAARPASVSAGGWRLVDGTVAR